MEWTKMDHRRSISNQIFHHLRRLLQHMKIIYNRMGSMISFLVFKYHLIRTHRMIIYNFGNIGNISYIYRSHSVEIENNRIFEI